MLRSLCLALLCLLIPGTAAAQSAPEDRPRISFSGYLQPQYETRTRGEETADRTFFRRIVLTLDAALPKAWTAAFQVDAGGVASGDGDRPIVKDVWVRYSGLDARGIILTIGNQKLPFSRTLFGSASRRGLLERPITGDRGLGSPGRALTVRGEGWHRARTIYWSAAAGLSRQSPDPDEIRIDGIAEAEAGWNEGSIVGGRIELHPWGEVPRDQGDFQRRALKFTVGAGAYGWWNHGEAAPDTTGVVDADRVRGLEVSGALRGHGVSMDAEFEHIVSRAVNGSAAMGLYENGAATISKGSVEAGYMVAPRLEALIGFDIADAYTYDTPWHRISSGMNWYVRGHRVKFSFMHRESFNDRGSRGVRSRATYLQSQLAF